MRRRGYTIAVASMLGLVVLMLCAMGYIGFLLLSNPAEQPTPLPAAKTAEPTLLTAEDLQPDRDLYFHQIDGALQDDSGQQVTLSSLRGRPVMLLFWSSWCGDCKTYLSGDFSQAAQAARDAGAAFHLVCREGLKGDTRQSAEDVLAQYAANEHTWMDAGATLYHALGLHSVPSLVILDAQGRLMLSTATMPDAATMQAMLAYAVNPQAQTLTLLDALQDGSGLVRSAYRGKGGTLQPENSLLSESQGLMLLWAVAADDQPRFHQLWQGICSSLSQGELTAWQVVNGQPSHVNAALDDLRIIHALALADSRWGGYASAASSRAQALYNACVRNDLLRDFSSLDGREISPRVTLCYLDVAAMDAAAAYDARWVEACRQARQLLMNPDCLVSQAFPLYRTGYDAATGTFTGTRLQMNEAMVTVLNAVRAGIAFPETLDWLASALSAGPLYAYYGEDGQPLPGYRYESTATYALLVQIGAAAGREDITMMALERMERQRCFQAPLVGGYGATADAAHYTFDTLQALLAWQSLGW